MFILIVFDGVQIEHLLDEAFRRTGRGLSFSSAHVTTLRHHAMLDPVPDAVVADVRDTSAAGLGTYREELARRAVPLFMLTRPSFRVRAGRDLVGKAEVFDLDREQVLADPVAFVHAVVSYVDARSRSDGSGPAVPGH